jgi:hypothetical protein
MISFTFTVSARLFTSTTTTATGGLVVVRAR